MSGRQNFTECLDLQIISTVVTSILPVVFGLVEGSARLAPGRVPHLAPRERLRERVQPPAAAAVDTVLYQNFLTNIELNLNQMNRMNRL